MLPAAHLVPRQQLWNVPPATRTSSTVAHHCTPFTLPSFGVIALDATSTITLAIDATFTPECTANIDGSSSSHGGPQSIIDMRDPFNASVTPQVYATGAATVIAWMLVIMLIITPRTFFMGGAGGSSGLLGHRGMISGASGGASVIGVGSRPWLQKVAALTVAISLTIATADTFRVAEKQYNEGFMDAMELRNEVVGGLEIKISRVVSDIFLWLAQVQTLIRLFSRHKEKVIIKWTGFGLIVLDMTFSILNNFLTKHGGRPLHFVDAIPALNYLFQCALSMLYAAWVIYYALTKRRYAFYHKLMPNMIVVAILSIIAILTPLVFFITDISNYNVAGWGDYFRWVGAAAASVIVWEWVERIEALERDEKKDGILGREVFDGDDMLENTPHSEVHWPNSRHDHGGRRSGFSSGHHGHGLTNRLGRRPHHNERTIMVPLGRVHSRNTDGRSGVTAFSSNGVSGQKSPGPTPPQPVASPVSRADTTSATSTIYTIRYHTMNEPTTPLPRPASEPPQEPPRPLARVPEPEDVYFEKDDPSDEQSDAVDPEAQTIPSANRWHWPRISTPYNPFKKRKSEPPTAILGGRVVDSVEKKEPPPTEKYQPPQYGRWDWKGRLGVFAAEQSDRLRERASGKQVEMILPVTIIPAQPRGRTWSPKNLTQQDDDAEAEVSDAVQASSTEVVTSDANQNQPSHQRSISFAEGVRHAPPRFGFNQQLPIPMDHSDVRSEDIASPIRQSLSPISPISPTPSNTLPSPSRSTRPDAIVQDMIPPVSPDVPGQITPPQNRPPDEHNNNRQGPS